MCSRLDSGSASMPTSPSSPLTYPSISSRIVSRSAVEAGACSEPTMSSGTPEVRTGCVDREVDLGPQGGDLLGAEAPTGEAVLPRLRLLGGEVGHRHARLLRVTLVDPRLEVAGGQVGEGEAQVGEIALRVDQQRGHAGRQGFLDQHDAEAGLSRAGHADDHAVGRQLGGGQRHLRAVALVRGRVDVLAQEQICHAVECRPTGTHRLTAGTLPSHGVPGLPAGGDRVLRGPRG